MAPRFRFDKPGELLDYTRARAQDEIGDSLNDWAALIEGAATRMRRTGSPDDRAILRDVALTGIATARRCTSGKSQGFWDHEAIRVRVTYLRAGEREDEWNRGEAAEILDLFEAGLPVDYNGAVRTISVNRGESPIAVELFQTAGTLRWMQEVTPRLNPTQQARLEPWLAIRSRILEWFNTSQPQAV